jgi:hypothetical protein
MSVSSWTNIARQSLRDRFNVHSIVAELGLSLAMFGARIAVAQPAFPLHTQDQ